MQEGVNLFLIVLVIPVLFHQCISPVLAVVVPGGFCALAQA